MTYQHIRYEVTDHIATVTLNRPERLNAFIFEMGDEIMAAMDRIDADDDVRAVVFTGAGRAYCAGADLAGGTEIFEHDTAEFSMERDADYGGTLARRFYESTKPLIAAINGPAVGIGISSTLPMDIRLASETARIGFVFTRRGLVPEACSSWFLPKIVGISRAAEWIYSGRIMDADEALRAGLVRSVHPVDELLPAAYALAHELTDASSPVAVAISRRMLWRMLGASTPSYAHELDSRGIFSLGREPDAAEGVSSFLQKRPAEFPMSVSTDLPEYFQAWRKIPDPEFL
ncbi:enoyl-CoA hydratase [Jatrophihabitans sp. GAS493]|uniref:crotonase/enoyl-CoA hydratase family protein n=1 Tax=Jatrophihabitans sp. GAS493 TaxID=1907575 RepID=UPI000BB6F682|nr:crotonase/enoyl-CoA hydratase family protein [Jatrophihabitans sp. GAS493]SOD74642.1 enoyl-CoA hydratase [Jatrophihabitans sp. GAS493]